MKKIGILTLSASDNCGSLLQTYALQEFLKKKCDVEVYIINFNSKKSQEVYAIIPPKFYIHPKKTLFCIRYFRLNRKQKNDYDSFRKEKLNLTKEACFTNSDLQRICQELELDIIIVGSDQVWNMNMTDFSECFYLPFNTNARKVSYAASLGAMNNIANDKMKFVTECLNDFEMISVREPSGSELLGKIMNKNIPVLSDPTMLHNSSFWKKIAGKREVKEPYIFFYSWAYRDAKMNEIVRKFSEEKSMPVFVINSSKWYKFRPKEFGFRLYEKSGPDAFLNLMSHAEYVFVQSFHGVVFSNLLNKRFFFLNEQKDKIDFRTGNLIKLLHEENQIVHEYEDISNGLNTNLEFQSCEINNLIAESKKFLYNVIDK